MDPENITADQLYLKLKDDSIFRDYFNKFCCLPVFGQRVTYLHRRIKFVFDPPPLRNSPSSFKVPNSHVRDWLVQERLLVFLRSKIAAEYHLVQSLLETRYNVEKPSKQRKNLESISFADTNIDRMFYILDELKRRHLIRVRHMRRFSHLVRSSNADAQIINFWVETHRIRYNDVDKRPDMLRKLQKKYLMSDSSHCLPYYILGRVYPERNELDQYGFDLPRIVRLQALILHRLHVYWLPRYLLARRNVSRSEKNALRQLEVLAPFDQEEEMVQIALDKCPYAKKIPDPEAQLKEAAKRARKNKEGIVFADDDDENILVTEEQKDEIWEDEDEDVAKKLEARNAEEHLGSEDVEFIHDHIFGKELAPPPEEKSKKSKKGKPKKESFIPDQDAEYVLFPGKTIVVKASESSASNASSIHDKSVSKKKRRHKLKKHLSSIREKKKVPDDEDQNESQKLKVKMKAEEDKASTSKIFLPDIKQLESFDLTTIRKSRSDFFHISSKSTKPHKSCSAILQASDFKGGTKISWQVKTQNSKIAIGNRSQCSSTSSSSSATSSKDSSESSSSDESTSSWEENNQIDRTESSESVQSSSIKSNQPLDPRKEWKKAYRSKISRDHYLRSVDADMKLRDILAADKIAGYPFRNFLATKTDSVALDTRSNAEGDFVPCTQVQLTTAYDVWREIESMRTRYFSLHSHELIEKLNLFRSKFAKAKSSPFYQACQVEIYNDRPFPESLDAVQEKIEKLMEPEWIKFAIEEQKKFRFISVTTDRATFKARYSFPNSLAEIRAKPILQKPLLTHLPQYMYDEFENLVKSGKLGSLGPEGIGSMRYRVSRAYRLFMDAIGTDVSNDDKFFEFIGDESSDEEGGIPPAKRKTYVRLPVLDPKEVAMRSAIEYPRHGIDYKQCLVLRMRTQQKLEGQPLYLRPVKKHGVVLTRPDKKPKCLDDVLRDPLHYEFFKRYMKMHSSEAPLLFWKSVELLKRTENPMARQKKAQQILKKFFSRVAGGGIMLQCDSEIIKEVAAVETVTTSMLVQTSIDVFKSMETNWAERYFNTFPEESIPEEEEPQEERKLDVHAIKTSRAWNLFSDYIRRVARFVKNMRDRSQYEEFNNYLKKLPDRPDSTVIAGGDASSTALLFQKYETVMYKHMNTDLEIRHRTKHVNGKNVTLNFLPNDLSFWLENDRYVNLCDNAKALAESGCYTPADDNEILDKKDTIVKCFLESYVPPKTRVNMDTEKAEKIAIAASDRMEISRSVFHEGLMDVFPSLMHFWKKHRGEKFAYVSKRTTKLNHHAEVEERRQRIENKNMLRKKKLAEKVPRSKISRDIVHSSHTTSSIRMLPDYVKDLNDRPYDKVKGLLYSDPPTLHFSMEQGLKLILPPRRRLVERMNNDDTDPASDEDYFLKVWTRGAKVVNVFRQGSDPRLVNLDDTKRRFKVKCDMIES